MNTFTPCLTYLLRSNTDVTSLLSGTSIKAIISYVTDYVTKPTLKTHQIFSSAYDVYDKHSELIGGDVKEHEAARKLILKIVNALTSKLEIGSPMACMYLLGNPDHYTSHEFVPFWWKMLGRENGNYVGKSNVDDYKFRPKCYGNLNLYQWIQTHHKKRRSKKAIEEFKTSVDNPDALSGRPTNGTKYQAFLPDHPLYSTHEVFCKEELLHTMVPNFVGGPLPRPDMGDREKYCMTMLTLFRPWRTGQELKRVDQSWDEAFIEYQFSARDTTLINNLNLKYECLDARDDFHGELNRKIKQANNSTGFDSDDDSDYSDADYDDYTSVPNRIPEYNIKGKKAKARDKVINEIDDILSKSGWTNEC
ncbi:hypothetical protein BDN70DRAFT_821443, partial [Pholiota conissans]